ncbi:hypothetical protein DYB36_006753 [Aphanomyces astaci]|uniref:Extradiol ring-cleavage dioxygenase class III enzyme subunit B domain-containing protein n=1 Tax=Aphanomyces astaci TaxID=112090 RepID=A0A397ELJ4_APHAT|nr:hypothetical protein DYB36_006753 [Aphanomyces astaci]RHY82150.1 hypothetical protein DYB31_011150 [Aphanomyces astaci]
MTTSVCRRAPAIFVNHGAGPLPVLMPVTDPDHGTARAFLEQVTPAWLGLNDVDTRPSAIVLVTAHWEESTVAISSGASHPLLYDYGGFPKEAYALTYNAKGSPAIAHKIHALLTAQNIPSKLDPTRGWDHGLFVPMKLINPAEDIPIVQLSVVRGSDPDLHFRIGEALAPLRDENIAILGSGMSYHSFHGRGNLVAQSKAFNDALVKACAHVDVQARGEALKAWEAMPGARECHPREEHLIPLHVIAGAAGHDALTSKDILSTMFEPVRLVSMGWGVQEL